MRRAALATATCSAVAMLTGPRALAERPQAPGHQQGSGAYRTVIVGRRSHQADATTFSTHITINSPTGGQGLADVLRQVPGVDVTDYGTGQRQTVTLRGGDAHQVAVFLDGIPLTAPGRDAVDLSLFDAGQLGAVDVHRSGSSAGYGGGALGGAIDLQTPRLRARRHARASLSYGAWNTLHGRLAYGERIGNWRYLSSGSYRRSNGDYQYIDHNGRTATRRNNDSNIGELLLKADHIGLHPWHIGLLNSFAAAFRGAPGTTFFPSNTARQRELRDVTGLHLKRFGWIGEGSLLDLVLYNRYGHFRFEETQDPPVLSKSHDDSIGGRARASLRPISSLAVEGSLEGRTELFFSEDTGNRQRGTLELTIKAKQQLWRHYLLLSGRVRLAAATGFSAEVAPRAGLTVRPLGSSERWYAALQLLAGAGRSYRLPSFQEMFLRVDGFGPNPDLLPEDAWNIEVGLRWPFPWFSVEAAYFRRWLNNVIIVAQESSFLLRPGNFHHAGAQGVEAALDLTPGLCLALRAAYTFTETKHDEPSRPLPGHPRHRWVGRISWTGDQCPAHYWRDASEANANAEPSTPWYRWLEGVKLWSAVTAQGPMTLDRLGNLAEEGRVLLSAGGGYTYRWLTIDAEGRNLLDKRDAVDSLGFPLAPRSLFITATASL